MSGAVFTLPDLGEGLRDAEIVAWHVAEGDHVVADQPLVSVETDKAVVEIPSPRSGRVQRLLAEPGARIAVGAPLVEFTEGAEADAGAVVGRLPEATPAAAAPPPAHAATPAIAAMPAARARAQALGLDLSAIRGSGPGGTVTLADVEAAAAIPGAEPLRGVRLAMARSMARFRDEVAPTTVCDDADIGDWVTETDVTLRLVRAVAAGCRAAPALNAWLEGEGTSRRLHAQLDLGIAVDTEDGLFVPVLRDAGARPTDVLRADFAALKAAVRDRSIAPAALRGATVTLSNFGMLGGRYAALALVPPQVAILGAGRIAARPAVHRGTLAVRRLLPLSLTFDHRAVTGAEAARFLAAAIDDLTQPA
ncbi:2-oxo acid dehydrogenase subunit E2 [Roseomonas eburnea]|uniref:Dihydrolipoamide acetyltransferase component of pyruvate dehydrogenase complex n=1 Tax=Neoroseomonas eburnea TaxID=1346889 RepID=A0A9X9XJ39_9PROT|nr:dihydrolipoamide acetyltransferase family protein [Neoroseomonas eburnea]MBR0683725.1 2-oxo acid dehydrogenase subunit E2 [Neoroseomonas eburnea]